MEWYPCAGWPCAGGRQRCPRTTAGRPGGGTSCFVAPSARCGGCGDEDWMDATHGGAILRRGWGDRGGVRKGLEPGRGRWWREVARRALIPCSVAEREVGCESHCRTRHPHALNSIASRCPRYGKSLRWPPFRHVRVGELGALIPRSLSDHRERIH